MTDGWTLLVAMLALCGVDLVLIWQMSTRIDRKRDMDRELRRVETELEHMMRKELEDDGSED